jgi:putative intracellular protease/amidase
MYGLRIAFVVALYFISSISAIAAPKVLMLMPNDFMWPEYSEPRKLYEAAGFEITTAGKLKEKVEPDLRNRKDFPDAKEINVDLSFDEVNIDNYDAITFVAGNGAWHDFFPNQRVHDLVKESFKKRKIVGLLCASTGLLGLVDNWDGTSPIAAGRKAVGYFPVAGIIEKLGQVNYIEGGQKEPGVEVDGNLVTGRNPESSTLFGQKIVELLKNKSRKIAPKGIM